jgi:hypothetical protein
MKYSMVTAITTMIAVKPMVFNKEIQIVGNQAFLKYRRSGTLSGRKAGMIVLR